MLKGGSNGKIMSMQLLNDHNPRSSFLFLSFQPFKKCFFDIFKGIPIRVTDKTDKDQFSGQVFFFQVNQAN